MTGAELCEQYSDGRARLARLTHWRSTDEVVDLPSLEAVSSAYMSGIGVVWMHWDVSTVGATPGDRDWKRLTDAEFLTKFLTDAFAPSDGDPVDQIIKWRLNLVGTHAFGGLTSFEWGEKDRDEFGPICMFDSEVFEINYTAPSRMTAEEACAFSREYWRRVLLRSHRIVGIAVPCLVITLRNDAEPTYLDEEAATRGEEEDGGDEPLSPPWAWSAPVIAKGMRRRLAGSTPGFRSGDFLAVIARECVEAYEEPRSWLLAEAEEVEVARFAPDLIGREVDQAAFAHRHAWLLQQVSRVRAALDWARVDRDVPLELFVDERIGIETEERRRKLLAALTEVRTALRSALDLVATSSAAEQLELSRTEAARSSAFQSAITFVTAVLLAPGLVAAIYGAMPSVLADRPGLRFAAIIVSMFVAGGIALVALRSTRRGASAGSAR